MDLLREMDWSDLHAWVELYQAIGPIPGVLMLIFETYLPVLPLIVVVMANSAAFGLWEGFFYSWIGVSVGQTSLFWIVRKLSDRLHQRILRRFPGSVRFFHWIEEKGFAAVFFIGCFPFSPSTTISLMGGLTAVPMRSFFVATFASKAIMVFILSYIGQDFDEWLAAPWKMLLAAVLMVILYIAGDRLVLRRIGTARD
jgi:uncharacterized membrane protein YdjX (TVP38/TMEM64 family)